MLPAKSGIDPLTTCSIRSSYALSISSRPFLVSSMPCPLGSLRACLLFNRFRRAALSTTWSATSGRNSSSRSSARLGRLACGLWSTPSPGSIPAARNAVTHSPSNTV